MTITVTYSEKVSYDNFILGIRFLQGSTKVSIDEPKGLFILSDTRNNINQIIADVASLKADVHGVVTDGTVETLHFKAFGKESLSVTGLSADASVIAAALGAGTTALYTAAMSALVGDLIGTGNSDHNIFEVGVSGTAKINAKAGDDELYVWHRKHVIFDGGAGVDSVTFDSKQGNTPHALHGLQLDLATGKGSNPYGGTVAFKNVENVYGSSADDSITGSATDNLLSGSFGADTLKGMNGNDLLNGGFGNDKLYGGNGDDRIVFTEGADVMAGGRGFDSASFGGYGASSTSILIDLVTQSNNTGDAAGDKISSIERFSFGATTLKFVGTSAAEVVDVYAGGKDHLSMGAGNDIVNLSGEVGGDVVNGGIGRDSLSIAADGLTTIDLQNQSLNAGGAHGSIFKSIEIFTFNGTGIFRGDANANTVYGSDAIGSFGKDILNGRGGNDILVGRGGGDDLSGGAGSDTFLYIDRLDSLKLNDGGASLDIIQDFHHAQGDTIDLHMIDANGNKKGNQAFDFIGTMAFSGTAGELRFEKEGGNTFVYADTDGVNGGDFAIEIKGTVKLVEHDFMI